MKIKNYNIYEFIYKKYLKNKYNNIKNNNNYRCLFFRFLLVLINIIKIIVSYWGRTKNPLSYKNNSNKCQFLV